ncbi:MAG: hypothetical protein HY924_05135 [Elusimicrobia bacterium]|nr:hypothetical protein [Elusimicrobiota bacterium]
MIPVHEARRQLGAVLLLAGVVHAAIMVYACLVVSRRAAPPPDWLAWHRLYASHFALMGIAGAAVIVRKAREGDLFTPQLWLDFFLGIIVFMVAFPLVNHALAVWLPARLCWLSLVTSAWLLGYGWRLFQGRQIWDRLDL